MRKLILASVAVLGFAGVAAAQEAPALIYGPASQNISSQNVSSHDGAAIDFGRTASVKHSVESRGVTGASAQDGGFNINQNDDYSGQ